MARRLWLALALLLAACAGTPGPRAPLPELHLAGVSKIPGLATVPVGLGPGHFVSVATYPTTSGSPETRVLFVIDGALYDVGLDGSGLRPIPLDVSCGFVSATADGHWAVCQGEGYGGELEVISLTGGAAPPVHGVTFDDAESVANAIVSPDGRSLAAVSRLGGGCAIAVYAISPAFDAFSLRATLSLPEFLAPGPPAGCGVFGIAWSPDERWLAFEGQTATRQDVYVFSLASVLLSGAQPGSPPIATTITSSMLTHLAPTKSLDPPAWSEVGGRLTTTLVAGDGTSFVQVTPATHEQTTMLAIGYIDLSAVAWTGDSRHFVFSLAVPACGDCGSAPGPQFALYVYTPPT